MLNEKGVPPARLNMAELCEKIEYRMRTQGMKFEDFFLVIKAPQDPRTGGFETGSFTLSTPYGGLPTFFVATLKDKHYLVDHRRYPYPSEIKQAKPLVL